MAKNYVQLMYNIVLLTGWSETQNLDSNGVIVPIMEILDQLSLY